MAEKPKHPRSQRTIFPKTVEQPLSGERLAQAKEAEAARAKHDKMYITADEAQALPPEAAELPEIRSRVEYSRHDWPENRASATIALGPLPPGEGEEIEKRSVPAEEIFTGGKVGGE
jgi:hypothetical protein